MLSTNFRLSKKLTWKFIYLTYLTWGSRNLVYNITSYKKLSVTWDYNGTQKSEKKDNNIILFTLSKIYHGKRDAWYK